MSRKYGISAVSFFPWCLGPGGHCRTIEMALAAGFNGIQALPLRGWDLEELGNLSDYVISVENAWNYGPIWQVPLRHLGIMPNAPTLKNLIFKRAALDGQFAQKIEHDWTSGALVEISPKLETRESVYVRKAYKEYKFVWDTRHIREEEMGDWRKFLYFLPFDSIGLVHVQPIGRETEELIQGIGDLPEMLRALNERIEPTVPVILELHPKLAKLTTPKSTIRWAAELRDATARFL